MWKLKCGYVHKKVGEWGARVVMGLVDFSLFRGSVSHCVSVCTGLVSRRSDLPLIGKNNSVRKWNKADIRKGRISRRIRLNFVRLTAVKGADFSQCGTQLVEKHGGISFCAFCWFKQRRNVPIVCWTFKEQNQVLGSVGYSNLHGCHRFRMPSDVCIS